MTPPRLLDDRRGAALVEFAFTVPILVLLFVGTYQLSDAVAAYRKVTTATRAVADLATQYSDLQPSDLDTILNAGQQVLAPYHPALTTMTVSQVDVDAAGRSTVAWSRGKNGSRLTPGSDFAVPERIKQAGASYIVAEIRYDYTPIMAGSLIGRIPMRDRMIMNPRKVDSIPCPQCS